MRVVLIAAIFVVANFVAYRIFVRLDLTEYHVYTLAKASKDAVGKLDKKLMIKAYFSPNLPSPYNQNEKYLRDLLDDYKAYSKGKLEYQFVDPGSEDKLEKEANNFQIPPVQVDIMQNDRVEARKVYMGVVLLYGDQRETMPVIQSSSNLEYDMTITIRKLTLQKQPTIGFVSDGGSAKWSGGYREEDQADLRKLQGAMEKGYKTRPVTLSQPVPSDIDLLAIIRPNGSFDAKQIFNLDQYVMKGGKLLVAAGRVNPDLRQGTAARVDNQLFAWLKGIGIGVEDNLIGDFHCGYIMVTQQQGFMMFQNQINYPFFPQAVGLNKSLPVVKDLQELDFYFPSSVDTVSAKSEGLKVQVIARSSNKSMQQRGRYDINPLARHTAKDFVEGPFAFAVAFSGRFPSYYKTNSIPFDSTANRPLADASYPKDSKDTRVVVIGEGNFITDGYLQNPANRAFFLNTVDWLSQDESLLEIRTRDATTRPLAEVAPASKSAIKYGLMLSPVALLVLFGIWRWQSSKRKTVWEEKA